MEGCESNLGSDEMMFRKNNMRKNILRSFRSRFMSDKIVHFQERNEKMVAPIDKPNPLLALKIVLN